MPHVSAPCKSFSAFLLKYQSKERTFNCRHLVCESSGGGTGSGGGSHSGTGSGSGNGSGDGNGTATVATAFKNLNIRAIEKSVIAKTYEPVMLAMLLMLVDKSANHSSTAEKNRHAMLGPRGDSEAALDRRIWASHARSIIER